MKRIFYSMALALCALMVSIPAKADGYTYSIRTHEQLREALRTGTIDARGDGEGQYQLSEEDILVLANDIIFDQELDGNNLNRDLLYVTERGVSQYNLDLNGFTIQRNISNPVGQDAVSVFSFKQRESVNPACLVISDSKGGGKVIANMTTIFSGGNYPTAVLFPTTCPGPCTLIVSGGSLMGQVMGSNYPGAAGVTDYYGCTTIIHGGFLTAYTAEGYTQQPTLKLFGGVIGDSYNIQPASQSGIFINGSLTDDSNWQAATIYGITYNKTNAFSSLIPSTSKVKLNGSASTISALNALSNSQKKAAKIDIYEEFDLTVNNVTVTTLNKDDVLGDGKVVFKANNNNKISGALYLNGATLTNITNNIPDLSIILTGTNTLNGDLISYNGNVELLTPERSVTSGTPLHKLNVTYAAETPVMIYGGDLSVMAGVSLNVDGKNNQNAVECNKFTLYRCWFDATVTGAGPVVKSTSTDIDSGERLISGSLSGKSVSYQPDLQWQNLYILGRHMNAWDVSSDITGDGISGKVTYYGSSIEMENAFIDARGKGVEAIKGQINNISFKGINFIISDNNAAIKLDNGTKTTFAPYGTGESHLYIISGTYGINASGVGEIDFGNNSGRDPITIYAGSTGIYGNNDKPIVKVYSDLDISCSNTGLPMYKVNLQMSNTRTSDFGGDFDSGDGVFTKANGGDADHVTFKYGFGTKLSGTAYPIEVAGVTITTGNAADVLGDGKVSYNASTNTLTLNNANVDGMYTPGIRVTGGGLNIKLNGSSAVQSSNPNGALYTVNGDLNISGGNSDSLFVFGRGMLGLNRMTRNYRTAITGGCYVSAICRDDNFIQSYRSAGIQSDSLYVNASTLYAENRSSNTTNKVSLYSYNANLEPGLLLVDAEIIKGEPNTPDPLLIAPTSGQAIENIQVEGDQPQKILHEGQIYIFRGGKIYTVQGAQMK